VLLIVVRRLIAPPLQRVDSACRRVAGPGRAQQARQLQKLAGGVRRRMALFRGRCSRLPRRVSMVAAAHQAAAVASVRSIADNRLNHRFEVGTVSYTPSFVDVQVQPILEINVHKSSAIDSHVSKRAAT